MHEYILRSLVDEHRRQLLAGAEAQRHITAARTSPYNLPATLPDVLWAEGTLLNVRPIATDDVDRLVRLFGRLSPRSVQLRFFSPIRRLSRAQLTRLVTVDHDCREALVALSNDEIIAVARYEAECGARKAEVAVTVEDTWQHRGIGKRLVRRLSTLAVTRGFDTFVATILPENRAALRLVRTLSPNTSVRWGRGEYEASIPLTLP
jgi:GNAT superfamily N-acetyltransferase